MLELSGSWSKIFLTRGVTTCLPSLQALEKKLSFGKPLRVKYGIDPTTSDLHFGHLVILRKLKTLQDHGHQIIFLIGDFTGRFGDPTGEVAARKIRSPKEVRKLASKYINQVGKVLDLKKTEIRWNSEWYDKMSAEELLSLAARATLAQMLERDFFQKRISKGLEIRLHELIYPLLQGYDSVMISSDLTIIGQDQLFNEVMARTLQKSFGQKPQGIVALELLIGTDGERKMSQSLKNYIKLVASAHDQFGKIMSIPDKVIEQYLTLLTDLEVKAIMRDLSPLEAKFKLAQDVVEQLWGPARALKAKEYFRQVFQQKQIPKKIPQKILAKKEWPVVELIFQAGLVESKSEARRVVLQGGVKIDGRKINDPRAKISVTKTPLILKVGPRRFIKIAAQ